MNCDVLTPKLYILVQMLAFRSDNILVYLRPLMVVVQHSSSGGLNRSFGVNRFKHSSGCLTFAAGRFDIPVR